MWRGFVRRKALVKTVSWRGMSFLVTTFGVWAMTGRFTLAASVGCAEIAVKSVGFYLHECFWESVAQRGICGMPLVAWVGERFGRFAQRSHTIQTEEVVG